MVHLAWSGRTSSFDDFARRYDRFCELEGLPPLLPDLLPELPTGGRALDAGCGSGRAAALLAARYEEVVGLDVSAPLVEIARERRSAPNVRYVVADLATYRDPVGFDLVYSATTLHHLPDLRGALDRLRSLVRPGGAVVLVDNTSARPTPPTWVYLVGALTDLPQDLRRRGPRTALELLRFRSSRPWLRHLASDRYLSAEQFTRTYTDAFPGARVLPLGWAHGCTWTAPGSTTD